LVCDKLKETMKNKQIHIKHIPIVPPVLWLYDGNSAISRDVLMFRWWKNEYLFVVVVCFYCIFFIYVLKYIFKQNFIQFGLEYQKLWPSFVCCVVLCNFLLCLANFLHFVPYNAWWYVSRITINSGRCLEQYTSCIEVRCDKRLYIIRL
jgi:hypothetical protein